MKLIDTRINTRIAFFIFLVFGFILYANTIGHEYALDDAIVLSENQFTKSGISGIKDILSYDTFTGFFGKEKQLVAGGRYRPLSLITFAIEVEFFGLNSHISHFINIILYILTVFLIFKVFKRLVPKNSEFVFLSISFLSALLFLFHPIHTEVVANIKGRDEILAFLFALLSLYQSLKYLEKEKLLHLLYSFIFFFLGLLSKENTITFVVIIPLALYFFKSEKLKNYVMVIVPLLLSSFLFLIIRKIVLGPQPTELPTELMNNPFIHNGKMLSFFERIPTVLLTFGMYLKLLIFPHPLTFDYYPKQIPIIEWMDWRAILPLVLYTLMFVFAIFRFKKKDILSFAILFFLISFSIVSNIVFPIGTFMNERFMYISSFGFSLILAKIFVQIFKSKGNFKLPGLVILMIILSGYTFKTIDRNKVWKNDYTLFLTDVKTSFNSAKSNTSAGGKLIEKAKTFTDSTLKSNTLKDAINYLEKAITIHPTYADAWLLLGNAHFDLNKNYEQTISCYMEILKRNPYNEHALRNIIIVLNGYSEIDPKIEVFEYLIKYHPNNFEINYRLGVLKGRYKGNLADAIPLLEKAVQLKQNSKDALKDLGVAYGMNNEIQKSLEVFLKAKELFPNDDQIFYNIGISYARLEDEQKAEEYFAKAKELKSKGN